MAYKDSDYTVVIAIMQWHKRKIIVSKLTLVVEIQALLSCRRPPLLDRSLRHWLPVQSYEGPTKILTVVAIVHWRLHANSHRAGEALSTEISSCLTFGCHCWLDIAIDDWAWSSRDMCINWNKLQYLSCVSSKLQLVATWLPGAPHFLEAYWRVGAAPKVNQARWVYFWYANCQFCSPLSACAGGSGL